MRQDLSLEGFNHLQIPLLFSLSPLPTLLSFLLHCYIIPFSPPCTLSWRLVADTERERRGGGGEADSVIFTLFPAGTQTSAVSISYCSRRSINILMDNQTVETLPRLSTAILHRHTYIVHMYVHVHACTFMCKLAHHPCQ